MPGSVGAELKCRLEFCERQTNCGNSGKNSDSYDLRAVHTCNFAIYTLPIGTLSQWSTLKDARNHTQRLHVASTLSLKSSLEIL